MTYIPKRKTLHIRHEDVVKSSYAYPKGRLWFGTDAQYTAEGYTVGNHVSTVNLTGSKYIDGNIAPAAAISAQFCSILLFVRDTV